MADTFNKTQTGKAVGNINTLETAVDNNVKANVWESALNLGNKVEQVVTNNNIKKQKEQAELQKKIDKQKYVQDTNEGTLYGISQDAKYQTIDIEKAHELMLEERNKIINGKSDKSDAYNKAYLKSTNATFTKFSNESATIKSNRQITQHVTASITNLDEIPDVPKHIIDMSKEINVPTYKVRDEFINQTTEQTVLDFKKANTKESYNLILEEYKKKMAKLNSKQLLGTTAEKGYFPELVKSSKKRMETAKKEAQKRYETTAINFLDENAKTYKKGWDNNFEKANSESGRTKEQQYKFKENYVKNYEKISSLEEFKNRDITQAPNYGDKEIMKKYPNETKKITQENINKTYFEKSESGDKNAADDVLNMINNNKDSKKELGNEIKHRINIAENTDVVKTQVNFIMDMYNKPGGAAKLNEVMSKEEIGMYLTMDFIADNSYGGDYIKARNSVNNIKVSDYKSIDKISKYILERDMKEMGSNGGDYNKIMENIYKIAGKEGFDYIRNKVKDTFTSSIITVDSKYTSDVGYLWDSTKNYNIIVDKSVAEIELPYNKQGLKDDAESISKEFVKNIKKQFSEDTNGGILKSIKYIDDKTFLTTGLDGNTQIYNTDEYKGFVKGNKFFGVSKEIFNETVGIAANVGPENKKLVEHLLGLDYQGLTEEQTKKASIEASKKWEAMFTSPNYLKWKKDNNIKHNNNFFNDLENKYAKHVEKLPTEISDKQLKKLPTREQYIVLGHLDENKYKQKKIKYIQAVRKQEEEKNKTKNLNDINFIKLK